IPWLSEMEWAGNSLLRWAIAVGVLVGVALVARIVKGVLTRRLRRAAERTHTMVDDAWVHVLEATAWFAYIALGLAVARPVVEVATGCAAVLNVTLQIWAERNDTSRTGTAAAATSFLGRLVIWAILTLVVLSNLGVEITAVVVGLGVGGVAAALAVQSILGDL